MIDAFAPGVHVSAFGPAAHPAISNTAHGVELQPNGNERQQGCYINQCLGNDAERWQKYNANSNRRGVEEQQVKPVPAPKDDDESTASAMQKLISNEVKSQVAHALSTIPDMVKEAGEQFFRTAPISAQKGIHNVVHDAVKHANLIKIRTSVLGETISKSVY